MSQNKALHGGRTRRFCAIGTLASLLLALGLFVAARTAEGRFLAGLGYAIGSAGALCWAATLAGLYLAQGSRTLLRLAGIALMLTPFVALLVLLSGKGAHLFVLVCYLGGSGALAVAGGLYCLAEGAAGRGRRRVLLPLGLGLLIAGIAGSAFCLR